MNQKNTSTQLSFTRLTTLILTAFLMSHSSMAADSRNSSWGQKNNWSDSSYSIEQPASKSPKRKSYLSEDRSNISPFSPGSNNLSLDVGQVFLMGDLASSYNDNIGTQLHYTYGVSDLFGFDASLGYSSHSDGKFSMVSGLMGLRTNLSWYDRVIPYATAGLGFYRPSFQLTPLESVSPVLFGLHVGPGVDLQLSKTMFFGASLTFHSIFGSQRDTSQGVRDLGGTYTSFLLRAGMTF